MLEITSVRLNLQNRVNDAEVNRNLDGDYYILRIHLAGSHALVMNLESLDAARLFNATVPYFIRCGELDVEDILEACKDTLGADRCAEKLGIGAVALDFDDLKDYIAKVAAINEQLSEYDSTLRDVVRDLDTTRTDLGIALERVTDEISTLEEAGG